MPGKYFVDTNILVYAHDRSAGVKYQRANQLLEQLWMSGEGVVSTQVLQELCVNLRRNMRSPFSLNEMRSLVLNYLSWHVFVNTPQSILEALEIEQRYKISFWDALILQAAEKSGATTVYSEDLSAGQKYGSIQVINPLLK
jgi:predicted nucleic acid-binding protein